MYFIEYRVNKYLLIIQLCKFVSYPRPAVSIIYINKSDYTFPFIPFILLKTYCDSSLSFLRNPLNDKIAHSAHPSLMRAYRMVKDGNSRDIFNLTLCASPVSVVGIEFRFYWNRRISQDVSETKRRRRRRRQSTAVIRLNDFFRAVSPVSKGSETKPSSLSHHHHRKCNRNSPRTHFARFHTILAPDAL